MDTPLTGPQAVVGQGDRETVPGARRYWNARGGIKGRRVVVDVLDNASNPRRACRTSNASSATRSTSASSAPATPRRRSPPRSLATQGQIPFIALSPPTTLVQPPRPYVYVALPTSRLYAYNMAQYLRQQGIRRIALMGDNGGFGRDGVGQVQALARAYGFTDHRERHLRADHDELHRRADADQELERAGALALDRHAGRGHDREGVPPAPALAAARPHGRQPRAAVPAGHLSRTSTARSSTATSETSGSRCRGATRTARTDSSWSGS